MTVNAIHHILTLVIALAPWSEKDYNSYDANKFFVRQDVNQRIDPAKFDFELLEAAVFYATNEKRVQFDLPIFTYDRFLLRSSRLHSANMKQYNFFSHVNRKKKAFKTPHLRIRYVGGRFKGTAENIAKFSVLELPADNSYLIGKNGKLQDKSGNELQGRTYKSLGKMIVDAWMDSEGHRENILGEYQYLGCGISKIDRAKDGMPSVYITQNFGTK